MSPFDFDVSAAGVKELLAGDGHYAPPARLLEDLTEAQAVTVPPGAPYSIAQIVTHMEWCQQGEIAGARGEPWPSPSHLEDTFASSGRGVAAAGRSLPGRHRGMRPIGGGAGRGDQRPARRHVSEL
jgi:hypothetical protein